MRWASVTDTGLIRPFNQDSLCISPEIGLFAVADGMGGHQAGEVASRAALQFLEQDLAARLKSEERPDDALLNSMKEANRHIFNLSLQNPDLAGMGTTVTACLTLKNEVLVAQVGDSRAYLLRGNTIDKLTVDHSLVQEMVKNGGITEEQAFEHPHRNILTRALGTEPLLEVDLYQVKVELSDKLLICTDGLTMYLRPEEIYFTVKSAGYLERAVQVLLEKALAAGGADNITIILVGFR